MRSILMNTCLALFALALLACEDDPTQPRSELAPAGFSISVNGLRVETIADVDVAMCDLCMVRYDWGDQSAPSDGLNASHSYASPGRYTITQTVSQVDAISLFTREIDLENPPRPPIARFEYEIDSADPLCVQFEDQSENMDVTRDSWDWRFGDGADSFDIDPFYCYSSSGTRTVTLRVTNSVGSDAFTRRISVSSGLGGL